MLTEDHSRRGRGCGNCSYVAHSDLLPQADVHVDSATKTATEKGEPVKAAPLPEKPPAMEENAAHGMSCIRDSFEAKGIPEEARGIMLQLWRESTRNQYGIYLKKWTKACSERNIDSHDISVNNVLKFLTLLYESGIGYSSITPLVLPCPHSIVVVHVLLETILLFVGS